MESVLVITGCVAQIFGAAFTESRAVMKSPDGSVAGLAQNPSHFSGRMIVIHAQAVSLRILRHVNTTDGTQAFLDSKHVLVLD